MTNSAAPPLPQPPPKPPLLKRIVAFVWELAALPGSGLFCLGRRRAAGLHFAAQALGLVAMIAAGLMGLPLLFWMSIGLLVVRQLVAAVQCLRSRGEAAGWGKLIVIGAIGLLLSRVWPVYVRDHFIEAFKIPSASMGPNLQVGDHIYVSKRAAPQEGDIVVYKGGPKRLDYVKRVIAVGPAEVRVQGRDVFVDGKLLARTPSSEPCTHAEIGACEFATEQAGGASYKIFFGELSADSAESFTTQIGPQEIYVLGDSRDGSWDSRQHGAVPLTDVQGVMTMIWW